MPQQLLTQFEVHGTEKVDTTGRQGQTGRFLTELPGTDSAVICSTPPDNTIEAGISQQAGIRNPAKIGGAILQLPS